MQTKGHPFEPSVVTGDNGPHVPPPMVSHLRGEDSLETDGHSGAT